MSAGATTLTSWSLAILGATIAGIVAGNFLRPTAMLRLVYLLFIPGWGLLGASIWFGDRVTRRFAAAAFTEDRDKIRQIAELMNSDYAKQREVFELALLVFGCWLVCLLLWWIFGHEKLKQHK